MGCLCFIWALYFLQKLSAEGTEPSWNRLLKRFATSPKKLQRDLAWFVTTPFLGESYPVEFFAWLVYMSLWLMLMLNCVLNLFLAEKSVSTVWSLNTWKHKTLEITNSAQRPSIDTTKQHPWQAPQPSGTDHGARGSVIPWQLNSFQSSKWYAI